MRRHNVETGLFYICAFYVEKNIWNEYSIPPPHSIIARVTWILQQSIFSYVTCTVIPYNRRKPLSCIVRLSIVRIFNAQKLSLRTARFRIGDFSESTRKSFSEWVFVVCFVTRTRFLQKKMFAIRHVAKGESMRSESTSLFKIFKPW